MKKTTTLSLIAAIIVSFVLFNFEAGYSRGSGSTGKSSGRSSSSSSGSSGKSSSGGSFRSSGSSDSSSFGGSSSGRGSAGSFGAGRSSGAFGGAARTANPSGGSSAASVGGASVGAAGAAAGVGAAVGAASIGAAAAGSGDSGSHDTATGPAGASSGPDNKQSGGGWFKPQSSPNQPSGQPAAANLSAGDKALAEKAKTAGANYRSREEAVQAFKAKEGAKYSTQFDREPPSRPAYIPETTNRGGNTYNIIYVPQYRGYGYYHGGSWVPYSLWDDHSQVDRIMRSGNYSHGPVRHGGRSSGWSVFWTLLILAGIGAGVYFFYFRKKAKKKGEGAAAGPQGVGGASTVQDAGEAAVYEKDNPDFWRRLKPSSIVTLSDAQSLKDSMDEGKGPTPRDYTVKEVRTVMESAGLAEWRIFSLDDGKQAIWLMVKIVDKEMDFRVYFEAPGFQPGNRSDVLHAGMDRLFSAPPDPRSFRMRDLQYSREIPFHEDDGTAVPFHMKPQGVLYGESVFRPPRTGVEKVFTAVAEYGAARSCENPEMLLIEDGVDGGEHGGFIRLLQGCKVNLTEVDVLNI